MLLVVFAHIPNEHKHTLDLCTYTIFDTFILFHRHSIVLLAFTMFFPTISTIIIYNAQFISRHEEVKRVMHLV